MHDAVQAIPQRFETYSRDITPASGFCHRGGFQGCSRRSCQSFPGADGRARWTYKAYLTAHQLTSSDPGAFGPGPKRPPRLSRRAPATELPGARPDVFRRHRAGDSGGPRCQCAGEPFSNGRSWLATARTLQLLHSSQMFSGAPPRMTSRNYTREYNEVKALGRNVGSTRTPSRPRSPCSFPRPRELWKRTMQ